MRVQLRVAGWSSPQALKLFQSFGIEIPESGHFGLWMDEDNPDLPTALTWMKAEASSRLVRTVFTRAETDAAEWLEMVPKSHWTYPQPEVGYRDITYDSSAYCELCGVGLVQVAPFRINREPNWAGRKLRQLNWVFDEYFTSPELALGVFADFGIRGREVLAAKDRIRPSIVQLDIRHAVNVDTATLDFETCATCGAAKYSPSERGFRPAPVEIPRAHLVRSRQNFGSDHSSFNLILVSQELRAALIAASVSGVDFLPCTKTPASR